MANVESTAVQRENTLLDMFLAWSDGDPEQHIAEIVAQFEESQAGANLQAAKAHGGSAFQKLVRVMVEDEVNRLNREHGLGLRCTTDQQLGKKNPPAPLDRIKRNLLVDYGKYGCYLPDADVIVYREENDAIVCVLSCKTSLRDRMKQTAYWKFKLLESAITRHIRICLVTLDKDGDLLDNTPPYKKNYAIASTDLDATYVLRRDLSQTKMIKDFSSFESDLRSWLGGGGGDRCLRTSPGKPSTLPNSINEHWRLARRSGRIGAVRRCSPIPMSHTKMPQRTSLRLGSDCGPSSAS